MTNDTIADMLTRIRNANLAKHQIVQMEKLIIDLYSMDLWYVNDNHGNAD